MYLSVPEPRFPSKHSPNGVFFSLSLDVSAYSLLQKRSAKSESDAEPQPQTDIVKRLLRVSVTAHPLLRLAFGGATESLPTDVHICA